MDWRVIAIVVLVPTASADVAWDAPDEAYAGHPVFAALEVDPDAPVSVEVWLDGFRLAGSGSIREDDGLFTLVATAPAAGRMRLVANVDGETAEQYVEVLPSENGTMAASLLVSGPSIWASAPHDQMALITVRDDQGGLLLSSWTENADYVSYVLDHAAARGVITDHPDDPTTRGALWADAEGTSSAAGSQEPLDLELPTCGDDILVEPPSVVDGALAWQAGTDVRVTDRSGPADYRLVTSPLPVGLGAAPTDAFTTAAADPWGQLTFSPGGVGAGILFVDDGDVCRLDFTVLPGTSTAGRILSGVQENPWGARIDVAALAGDVPLAGYAFDVRVIRLSTPGSLAWAGKLDASQGEASLHLSFLPPGDYVAEVYASPQDLQTPDVRDVASGHLLYFTLPTATAEDVANGTHPPWMAVPAAAPPAPTVDTPGPGLVVLLPLLWLALCRR